MDTAAWNPGTLLRTSGSYWQAFALHAGVKLDLFTLLAQESLASRQIADRVHADERGVAMLLNALCAMGLLRKQQDRFNSSEAARNFLDKNSEHYIGHMILHHHHLAPSWAQLDQAVINGKPLRTRASFGEPQLREAFLMGMFTQASLQAPKIASLIDLKGRRHLLDLGGGPGTYAIYFCRQNPHLKAVVYDLPTTEPFALKTIARLKLQDRVGFAAGDFLKDDLPGRHDVVWLSHILHGEGPQACQQLIDKAVSVLKPGGMILIHDFILVDTMDGPLFPALFSLNMLLGTDSGQSYSERQLQGMLEKAGIIQIRRENYCGPTESGIISGIKAG